MTVEGATTAELVLPSGRAILIESPEVTGARDVGMRGKLHIADFLEGLEELCGLLVGSVSAVSPTEAEVELSVGIEASSGKLLAFAFDGTASGAMKVRLTWKSEGSA